MKTIVAALAVIGLMAAGPVSAQTKPKAAPAKAASSYKAPRGPDGRHPDLNGVWQVMNSANWDIEPHAELLSSSLQRHRDHGGDRERQDDDEVPVGLEILAVPFEHARHHDEDRHEQHEETEPAEPSFPAHEAPECPYPDRLCTISSPHR